MKINYYKVSNSLIAKHLVKSNYIRMLLEQMKVMLDLNWEQIKYTLIYVVVCAFSEKMISKKVFTCHSSSCSSRYKISLLSERIVKAELMRLEEI